MLTLITPSECQSKIAANIKERRLSKKWTQAGIAERAGVPLATYRVFERTGKISLESFLRIANSLGMLGDLLEATAYKAPSFESIDDVINAQQQAKLPKRGSRN